MDGTRGAPGLLTVSSENPRYFEANDEVVYLTGSHTWRNLQDSGTERPPEPFDYPRFLDFLDAHNHNFFRLWAWEQRSGSADTSREYWFDPLPFERGSDGRFDLHAFDEGYFERLRARVAEAEERGFYVAVMLFNGWSIEDKDRDMGNPWLGHPLHAANNMNGVDGDLNGDGEGHEVHTLANPEVTAIQEAYVRRVVDAVNEFDNVLYEISNESPPGSEAWQYHMIRFVRDYERGMPKQHPIGMTYQWPAGDDQVLLESPADWISPGPGEGGLDDPAAATGAKVILDDTDHICGLCGGGTWVWKSFTRGRNPIFMDLYEYGFQIDDAPGRSALWEEIRLNLGFTRHFAERMDLASMEPRPELSSTGYLLADASPGGEYLAFSRRGLGFDLDLSGTPGLLSVEWFVPALQRIFPRDGVMGGTTRTFHPPVPLADAVLILTPLSEPAH